MSNLVIDNTTYVIENDIEVYRLSLLFSTPWLILKQECSWNGQQVKWIQVDAVNQTYQESAPSKWPRWIRIVIAILLLIPASLGKIWLKDKDISDKYSMLKQKLLQENKKKYLDHYRLAQIDVLPSEDNWGNLSIFPKDIRQTILLNTLEMNPSFKERAVLSLINKASYQCFNSSCAWNITTRHLGLKMKSTSIGKEFSIYRNHLICQHRLLEKKCQDLGILFDSEEEFLQLPIIYDQYISNELSKPTDLISERMMIQLPGDDLFAQLKDFPREINLVRVITSRGYNAFAIRCKEKFSLPISSLPSSWMLCYLLYTGRTAQVKSWQATVVSEFKVDSTIETRNSLISFKQGSRSFEEQTDKVKQLFKGKFCQVTGVHFSANGNYLSWEIARDCPISIENN